MDIKLNIDQERKITTNGWIINIRWLYMSGILLIGFLTKTISESNVDFTFTSMVSLFITYSVINLFLFFWLRWLKKTFANWQLVAISYFQIFMELIFFTIIMHLAGGIESISSVFYFLSVVSASLLFGSRGAILTAAVSGVLINGLIIFEYYGFIGHIPRYGVLTLEFESLPIALTKTIATSVFYLIVGLFAGFGANMLFKRESAVSEKTMLLDAQAQQLVKREKELILANRELDAKVAELENFQKQVVGRELKMIELKNKIKELTDSPKK